MYNDELYHHGILGQKWGKQNGPPYPLKPSKHSAAEKKAGWKKSIGKKTRFEDLNVPDKRTNMKSYEGYTTEDGWYPDEKMYVANNTKTKDGQKVRVEFRLSKEKNFDKYKSVSDRIVNNLDKIHENLINAAVDDNYKWYLMDNGLKDTPNNKQKFRNKFKSQMKMDTIALHEYNNKLKGEAWFNGNPVMITELFGDHSIVVHFDPKNGNVSWVEMAG